MMASGKMKWELLLMVELKKLHKELAWFWTGYRFFKNAQKFSRHKKWKSWLRDLAWFSSLLSLLAFPLISDKSILTVISLCKEYLYYWFHSISQVHGEHRLRVSPSVCVMETWRDSNWVIPRGLKELQYTWGCRLQRFAAHTNQYKARQASDAVSAVWV